ncbi:MAG: cytochrome c oxidase subunit II [Anaerolineales bacterium]
MAGVAFLIWVAIGRSGTTLAACPPECPVTFAEPASLLPASVELDKTVWLYNLIFGLAVIVFVVVEGLLFWTIFRFRNRPPESTVQTRGNTKLEIAWAIAPAVILAVIMGYTLQVMADIRGPVSVQTLRVKAIGHQYWWEFRYPGQGVVTASEMVVPYGVPIEVEMESIDVEHGFWAPELFGKVEAIPGYTTRLRFTPNQIGKDYYGGTCTQHVQMRFAVKVVTQAEFDEWAAAQLQPAPAADTLTGDAVAGAAAFAEATNACVACHLIDGVPVAVGKVGPNLTHVASRQFIAGGILENTPENLARWLTDPQGVKPGNLMEAKQLDDQTVANMVAYLSTLK